MSSFFYYFQIITLFFSILLSRSIYSEQFYDSHIIFTAFTHDSSENNSIANTSHNDFSYDLVWNNFGNHDRSTCANNFEKYTTEDFEHHFARSGYTESEILHQRCLYLHDAFVKYAQTCSGYKDTIQKLHAELKNLGIIQKAWYVVRGKYCKGLQNRIVYLYNQLDTAKTTKLSSGSNIAKSEPAVFAERSAEYKTLESTYNACTPYLAKAISKRLAICHNIERTNKSYNLNKNVKELLSHYGHELTPFTHCSGNQLQHAIHQESLDILDRIDTLQRDSVLYDHQEALVDFTTAMVDYNHAGLTDKAMTIGDLCWTLLDYGQAIAEGAALGIYSAVGDVLTNPIEATVSIVAGKQILVYQLCKVLYNVADIGVTAISDYHRAQEKWNKYAEPLNNIIDAINKKEITVRDAIKGGTAFVVGYKTQGKLLGGLGKLCNTIKHKSINFIKNSPLLNPQEYLTTPEGLLFKATAQSNKFKNAEQSAVSNLKKPAEKLAGTIWNSIRATDSMYPGTKIPKSFELTVGKQKLWVCPNSTEHMLEYIQGVKANQHKKIITHNMPINCQAFLSGFKAAVEQAISKGIKYDVMITVGCWELRFGMPRKEGLLPTIYHANFKPQNW